MNPTSPVSALGTAYIYITAVCFIFYKIGFYESSPFFRWGTPCTFFGRIIDTQFEFYSLLIVVFLHQLVNNWINSVVYPWILNSVQDPKTRKIEYSTFTAIFLVNLFNIYSEIDMVFILMGFTSQISFVAVVVLANLITSSYLNYHHLQLKTRTETIPILV
jgi:hypothetical protein